MLSVWSHAMPHRCQEIFKRPVPDAVICIRSNICRVDCAELCCKRDAARHITTARRGMACGTVADCCQILAALEHFFVAQHLCDHQVGVHFSSAAEHSNRQKRQRYRKQESRQFFDHTRFRIEYS